MPPIQTSGIWHQSYLHNYHCIGGIFGRTGGFTGSGSGETVIGFSTSNKVNHYEEADFIKLTVLSENKIDTVFRAASEATEEAILNSLICSNTTVGRSGHKDYSLRSFWETAEE